MGGSRGGVGGRGEGAQRNGRHAKTAREMASTGRSGVDGSERECDRLDASYQPACLYGGRCGPTGRKRRVRRTKAYVLARRPRSIVPLLAAASACTIDRWIMMPPVRAHAPQRPSVALYISAPACGRTPTTTKRRRCRKHLWPQVAPTSNKSVTGGR